MAAVVPQPPLLVPELAAGAAAEIGRLREPAAQRAVRRLAAAASSWVAIGADAGGRRTVAPETVGTLRGFGVDVAVSLGPGVHGAAADPDPGAAAADRGLVARSGRLATSGFGASWCLPDLGREACRELGARLADELSGSDEPIGLLVLGDGAATHTERAPGHLDPRAAAFDAAVAAALAGADHEALLALDPDLAAALLAAGTRTVAGAGRPGGAQRGNNERWLAR